MARDRACDEKTRARRDFCGRFSAAIPTTLHLGGTVGTSEDLTGTVFAGYQR